MSEVKDEPIVVQTADEDVLVAVPSENPPTLPLQCSCLLQVYADPRNPANIDLRISQYQMSWQNLQAVLYMALEASAQAQARAEAADKSVRAYGADGKPLPSNKPLDINSAPGIGEIVTLAKVND